MNAQAYAVPALPRRGESVAVTLVAHFERLIATGDLAPGAKLPSERELAAELGVSRSSLREAMHELESKRLVERAPGRGTRVREPSSASREIVALDPERNDQTDAAELRGIIEPSIAALAAARATAANLLQLHGVLDRSHEQLSAADSMRLDLEFHLLLAEAAQNPLLTSLQTMASEWTKEVRGHSHATRAGRRMSLEGHRRILEAIEAHDASAASEAMALHLAEVRALILGAAER